MNNYLDLPTDFVFCLVSSSNLFFNSNSTIPTFLSNCLIYFLSKNLEYLFMIMFLYLVTSSITSSKSSGSSSSSSITENKNDR